VRSLGVHLRQQNLPSGGNLRGIPLTELVDGRNRLPFPTGDGTKYTTST
jgi:hypothetical protein